ncbi:MAG: hypothetical protein KDB53_05520 [Planctomycetes bacterium]|nr:hypothetical protein [Planctomycetota bacterium]
MAKHPGDGYDFETLLAQFSAPVTDFDCGQLCSPENDGKPRCCEGEGTVPVLYRKEYDLLRRRSDLWKRYKPSCSEGRKMEQELGDYRLAVCKGVAFCERENRSLNCRSFPFMPYLDHDGEVKGLVFDLEAAEGKCPLVGLPQVVTKRYLRESMAFWRGIVDGDDGEGQFYRDESKKLRKRMAAKKKAVSVLCEEGIRSFPATKKKHEALKRQGKLPLLMPLTRPEG